MPCDAYGIAAADFHLSGVFAFGIDCVIDTGFQNRYAIRMIQRQFAEDKGKGPANKIEGDGLRHQQRAAFFDSHDTVEALRKI